MRIILGDCRRQMSTDGVGGGCKCNDDCFYLIVDKLLVAISHQATTTPAALAAGSTSNHVQVGGTDVQGPDHIDAGVPESSHQVT